MSGNSILNMQKTFRNAIPTKQWDNTISYSLNDKLIVVYNNDFYKCKVANSTIGTFIEVEWQILNGSVNNTLPSFDGTGSSTSYNMNTLPTF